VSTRAIRDALYFAGTTAADTSQAHEAYRKAKAEADAIDKAEERMRRLEEALGEISTSCETKSLRYGSKDDVLAKQRAIIDQVWSVAREALKP
jgi:septation ring formation regulator EzrA